MSARNCFLCLLGLLMVSRLQADEFDQSPINCSSSVPENRITALERRLASGEASLARESGLETLRALLAELEVPESSQVLVFSKTSMQRDKISPRTPRALYFSDDVYVGYCQNSQTIEISAVDPQLGTVYYAAQLADDRSLTMSRQTDNCLICHASSQTRQIPGHLVRSVYTGVSGLPVLSMGSHRIDHTSPLKDRWGGWYVSGTHGEQKHLGNLLVRSERRPEAIDNAAGQNVTDLSSYFDTSRYLSPHSDLVALMVLEHQAEAHNRITRASFQTRMALHQQEQLNKELGQPVDQMWDSTKSRIRSASEDLVQYLLFSEEASLKGKLQGTSSFATDFAAKGPRDPQGRSLRDFDLERRIFKYPLSYLVYSEAFKALPPAAKEQVWRRIWEVVSGQDQTPPFAHLSADDRQAIREIVTATIDDLPDYWHASQ